MDNSVFINPFNFLFWLACAVATATVTAYWHYFGEFLLPNIHSSLVGWRITMAGVHITLTYSLFCGITATYAAVCFLTYNCYKFWNRK